jgi:hypothetical protein
MGRSERHALFNLPDGVTGMSISAGGERFLVSVSDEVSGPVPSRFRQAWTIDDKPLAPYLLVACVIAFVIVLVRNAWVVDDAYITFRTVDNALHGGYRRYAAWTCINGGRGTSTVSSLRDTSRVCERTPTYWNHLAFTVTTTSYD